MGRGIMFLFILLFFLVLDLYAFQVVKTLTRSSLPDTRRIIYIIYWALPVISLVIWLITQFAIPTESISRANRQLIWTILLVPYFAKFFALPFLLIDDSIRLLKWAASFFTSPSSTAEHTISRSEFLAKTALVVGAATIGSFTYGVVGGAHAYRVRRVRVPIKNLPVAFDGLKIAQLSDIHSGSFTNKKSVEKGVEILMAEKPDLFCFTGDLVNNTADEVENYIDVFSKIKAPLGSFSILGNHDYGDYYSWPSADAKRANLSRLIESHKRIGWDLLLDQHKIIKRGNDSIALIGIQNWGLGGFAQYGNLEKAYKGTENQPVKILLSHDPSHWNAQVTTQYKDIDLVLAGHTHGMQFGIELGDFKWSPIQYRYKQWGGLYKSNNQYLYVNRGFGYLGYPGRVGILPEITILTLVKE